MTVGMHGDKMNYNKLVLTLILTVFLFSGCVGNDSNIVSTTSINNSTTINNNTLSIEESVYAKGETVRAFFKLNEDLYIYPLFKIYKFEKNDWNFIGEWSFQGSEYVCCGAFPPCEKYNVSDSPIEIKWDQNVTVTEGHALNENIPEMVEQVNIGVYKFVVIYGKKVTSCMDRINAEFLIK